MGFANTVAYGSLRYVKRIATPKQLIAFAMARHAGRVFADAGGTAMRYADVNTVANQLANALIARGVKKGAVVATLMQNSLEAAIIRIAVFKAGWIFCAMIDDFSEQAILDVLNEVGATVIFVDAANAQRIDFDALKKLTKIRLVVSADEKNGDVRIAGLLADGDTGEPDVEIAPSDVSAIGFTSGTTGRSKGVVWTQAAWMESFYHMLRNRDQAGRDDEVFLHVIPFSTAGCLVLLPCLAGGMRNVYLATADPRQLCETIQKERVTRTFLAPVFLVDLWDFYMTNSGAYDLRSLHSINVGSAPMSSAKFLAIQKDLNVTLEHGYGMAEVLAPLTVLRPGRDAVQPGAPLPVGHVGAGVKIEITDADESGCGRIAITSASRASGYWQRPELTAQHFVGKRFLSNDIGRFDGTGCLHLLDRTDDVVTRNGKKVFPRIIEERLHICESVKDAAVIVRGGKLTAFVTARRGHGVDVVAMRAFCEKWLSRHEQPDAFVVLDKFPVSTSGKILKRKLAETKGAKHMNAGNAEALDILETSVTIPETWEVRQSPVVTSYIAGTGSALPERVVTNADLSKEIETSDDWIRERTGIRERRYAETSECTSTYGALAAKKALAAACIAPDDVGLILLATTTPDMRFPATANFVQKEIGAINAFAYDLSAACCGFVFALATADAQIRAGMVDCALVIGADLYSTIVDPTDRKTCVLFGDGAGAVVLRRGETGLGGLPSRIQEWPDRTDLTCENAQILATALHSDASGTSVLVCDGSGTAGRTGRRVAECGAIKMDGMAVFRQAVRAFAKTNHEVLAKAGVDISDVACVIPHQANIRIIEQVAKDLGCGMDKVMVNLDRYGNTSAASIPIALDEAVHTRRISPGDLILLAAVGAGFSSGAVLLRL